MCRLLLGFLSTEEADRLLSEQVHGVLIAARRSLPRPLLKFFQRTANFIVQMSWLPGLVSQALPDPGRTLPHNYRLTLKPTNARYLISSWMSRLSSSFSSLTIRQLLGFQAL